MTDLAALTALCPPPTAVPPAPDWAEVEEALGTGLPRDYKELVAAYGPGRFCGFVTLYRPHAPNRWTDLTGPVPTRLRGGIEEVRQAARTPRPLPCSPEDLLAVGVTDNGDHLFWVTRPAGAPDEWTIAVSESLGAPWFVHDGTLTAFLVGVLGGSVDVPLFPRDLLEHGPAFVPSTSRSRAQVVVSEAPVSTRAVRDWANANGYDLPERGRVPIEVVEAWKRGNRSTTR
ncbi:histone-like nucleoid-structuring protein Lsr2 [Streptomyces cinereoruber]|uniref:Lsr2 family DNA-binding protein n=1 Tax=Streptomyces cinereoruber TaxID=67260 RepID=UPI0036351431